MDKYSIKDIFIPLISKGIVLPFLEKIVEKKTLLASKTRMRQQLILILTIFFLMAGLTSIKAQGLKRTIKRFTKIMSQTQASQTDFIQNLKPLIDPRTNVDSLCTDYYQHWKYNADINSFPIKTKIESVDKYSKDRATVRISQISGTGQQGKNTFSYLKQIG